MPYNSQVRVGVGTGSPPALDVSLMLWELSTTIDSANNLRHQQVDQDQTIVAVSNGVPSSFSFFRGPDFLSNNNHSISLSAYQNGRPGPVFRSGQLSTLPAGAPANADAVVDVMLFTQVVFTIAEINSMIVTPITLQDGTVISTVVISSSPPSRTLTIVATGPYGATTFTYTLSFTIDPSNDQFELSNVLEANAVGRGAIVFTAGQGGGLQAFIDNLFAGLFVGSITSKVVARITDELNLAAARAGAAAAAAAGAPSGIPPGVVLGVRSVDIASNGDIVMAPAIGSFGSVIQKFANSVPPGGGGTPGTSPKCSFAIAFPDIKAKELHVLRQYRDLHLPKYKLGRAFLASYNKISAPLAERVQRSWFLKQLVRKTGTVVTCALQRLYNFN